MIALEMIELPTRALNALRRAGIETVADLMNSRVPELIVLPSFGLRSLKIVTERIEAIHAAEMRGTTKVIYQHGAQFPAVLLECIMHDIDTAHAKERAIIEMRTVCDGPCLKVRQIAEALDLSQANASRIERGFFRRMAERSSWYGVLGDLLNSLAGKMPIALDELERTNAWLRGVSQQPHLIRYFVREVSRRKIDVLNVRGVVVLTAPSRAIRKGRV